MNALLGLEYLDGTFLYSIASYFPKVQFSPVENIQLQQKFLQFKFPNHQIHASAKSLVNYTVATFALECAPSSL